MANGLMSSIINPAQVDALGALDKGRERQATQQAGQILGETFTGKIGALARLSPDKAIALSKAVGIPLDDKGRLNNFMGTAVAANKLVQAGLTQEAVQFVLQHTTIPSGCNIATAIPFAMIGFTKVAREQGEWAATTALEILAGKKPSEIPVVTNHKAKIYLNMRLAKKLDITLPMELMEQAIFVE